MRIMVIQYKKEISLLMLLLLLAGCTSPPVIDSGTHYYIGAFTVCDDGPCVPATDVDGCGPAPTPCASFSFFEKTHGTVLYPGDTIHFATGVYSQPKLLSKASGPICEEYCRHLTGAPRAKCETACVDY